MQATMVAAPAPQEPHPSHQSYEPVVTPPHVYDTANMNTQDLRSALATEAMNRDEAGATAGILLMRNSGEKPDEMASKDARDLLDRLSEIRTGRAPARQPSVARDRGHYLKGLKDALREAESDGLGADHPQIVALHEELDRIYRELDQDTRAGQKADADPDKYDLAA